MPARNNNNEDEDDSDNDMKMPSCKNTNNDKGHDDKAEDDDEIFSYYNAEEAEEGHDNDNDEDDLWTASPKCAAMVNSNAFLSFFANDDNYDGEEEEHLPLDNNTAVHHTLVSGGPVKRNYSGMTVAEVNIAREQYKWNGRGTPISNIIY